MCPLTKPLCTFVVQKNIKHKGHKGRTKDAKESRENVDMDKINSANFPEKLKAAIKQGLPGSQVQWMMASSNRMLEDFPLTPGPDARVAAVLILLWPEKDSVHTVFMKRPDYTGFHGGQISFPGGKQEPSDENIIRTAFREAEEETGINSSGIENLGLLTPLFIPVSKMLVTAVTAWIPAKPVFRPDPAEVDFLIEADINEFMTPSAIKTKPMEIRGGVYEIRYFDYKGHVIWGATSMMLNELLEILRRF